jgi:hypothetical protein
MGRDLDLDNCTNKQEAILAAYTEELEENERKIVDERAWATSLDLSRIKFWLPILMRYCPQHPLTQDLKWERALYKRRKDLADFFFFDWD